MGVVDELIRSREAFERREWAVAYDRLAGVDSQDSIDGSNRPDGSNRLDGDDLARWAMAAYLLGRTDRCIDVMQRAHQAHREDGNTAAAIRCAFWIGLTLLMSGDPAVAGGWFARAWRLLESLGEEIPERGYLLMPQVMQHARDGDIAAAVDTAAEIERIGRRFRDPDLVATGMHHRGRGMLHLGRVPEGLSLMDESMVSAAVGEVTPLIAGILYCSMIEACQEISDFARAREWTSALTRWCATQPDLVPYTGQCAVHRGQIMRLQGAFADAIEELRLACRRYQDSAAPYAAGLALYECADVHRIRGEFAEAEDAYQEADGWGCEPQPGLALLWLAQGRVPAAAATVRRLDTETTDVVRRSKILPAIVEVLLASQDLSGARAAAQELEDIAGRFGCAALQAAAAYGRGTVLLADGDAGAALVVLRKAWRIWTGLDAPYDSARVRVQMGLACRTVGDGESARLELEAACRVLRKVGAEPAAAAVDALLARRLPDGLTAREVEVLRLVATGKSNPTIAAELFLSEKTVARHLSNIFTKIAVSTRTAAAAYAFEHHLL